MALNVGDTAPDFTLKDQNQREVKLSDYLGKQKVVLSFHPLAFTPVCATQMTDLERNRAKFAALNTVPLGLSIDSPFAKKAWADSLGITETSLLADFAPHAGVASLYGIQRPEGFSERAVYVIDLTGKIVFAKVYPIKEVPDIQEILAAAK